MPFTSRPRDVLPKPANDKGVPWRALACCSFHLGAAYLKRFIVSPCSRLCRVRSIWTNKPKLILRRQMLVARPRHVRASVD